MDANFVGQVGGFDAQLLQQIGEGDGADQPVYHQAHCAFFIVGADIDHAAGKTGVAHAGHGHQQLAGQITLIDALAIEHDISIPCN